MKVIRYPKFLILNVQDTLFLDSSFSECESRKTVKTEMSSDVTIVNKTDKK